MSAYAIATLRNLEMNSEIAEYARRIDDTLDAFGGRFLVHGGQVEEAEGAWHGPMLVVLEFPDMETARNWYASPAYQDILRLRTENSVGEVIFAQGVPEGYRAVTVADMIDAR